MVDRQELQVFHSTAYLAFLHSRNELQGEEEEVEEETEAYGLGWLVTCCNLEVYSMHILSRSQGMTVPYSRACLSMCVPLLVAV